MADSYDVGAYSRAMQGQRFEGSEAEGGKSARAQAQLAWEQTPGGQTWLANQPGSPQSYDKLAASTPSTLGFIQQSQGPLNQTMSQYIQAMQQRAQPLDLYKGLEEAMGIPQQRKAAGTLREQVYNLEDALKGVRGQVAGTTRESMVTEAQKQRLEQATARPLQENLGTIGTALGRVESAISDAERTLATKVGLALQGQEQNLEPYKAQLDYLQNQQAQLITGFSDDKRTTLDISLAKLKRGEQLSDMERNEAFQILQQENQYKQAVETMQAESEQRLRELQEQAKINQRTAGIERGWNVQDAQSEFERQKELARLQNELSVNQWQRTRPAGGTATGGMDISDLMSLFGGGGGSDWEQVGSNISSLWGSPTTQAQPLSSLLGPGLQFLNR